MLVWTTIIRNKTIVLKYCVYELNFVHTFLGLTITLKVPVDWSKSSRPNVFYSGVPLQLKRTIFSRNFIIL